MIAEAIKIPLKTIQDIRKELVAVSHQIIKDNRDEILDFNRKKQLFNKGEDSKGTKMIPSYAKSTKLRKRRKGLPTNIVTHFDSGKHYDNFDVITSGNMYEVFATTKTSKGFDLAEHLNEMYGGKVYGLTEENNIKVNEDIIKPKLLKWAFLELRKNRIT